jgi:hypothetical protein
VEAIMRQHGWEGACYRRRQPRTTVSDPAAARSAELVGRAFNPVAPNRLWVADFTYCPTWTGMTYVAFVIDAYARRVTEQIHRHGPWRDLAEIEVATFQWVDFFNRDRPHEYLDDLTPSQAEARHYAHRNTSSQPGEHKTESPDNPGRLRPQCSQKCPPMLGWNELGEMVKPLIHGWRSRQAWPDRECA